MRSYQAFWRLKTASHRFISSTKKIAVNVSSKIDCRGVTDMVREVGVFRKSYFLPLKYTVYTRNSIASAQNEKNEHFLFK